jgi:DNA replication protein DnaC
VEVVERLMRLRDDLAEHVRIGGGLVLYGPTGTGKDHLAVAMLWEAVQLGFWVNRVNGGDFYDECSASWRADSSEHEVIRRYASPAVLLVSDPALPEHGDERNRYRLYKLLEWRSRELRSTLLTVNVEEETEVEQLLGPQMDSRSSHDTLRLKCFWPDYRRQHKCE